MKKEYTKIASIPDGEKIISMTQYGGGHYWDLKYPFRHHREPRYLVATEKAIYQIEIVPFKGKKKIDKEDYLDEDSNEDLLQTYQQNNK